MRIMILHNNGYAFTSIFVIFLLVFDCCALQTKEEIFLDSIKLLKENRTEVSMDNSIFHPEKDVEFFLYTKYTKDNYEKLKPGDLSLIKDSHFNISNPTKIIVHGWLSSGVDEYSELLKNAFLEKGDLNVICVNWPAFKPYTLARLSVKPVANVLAEFLDFLIDMVKVDKSFIHTLGHSLGAHIAGIAGEKMKNGLLPHITGFDPAGPLFFDVKDSRLDSSDAEFVDVIHTSAGFLGYNSPIGHLDFYPNGGTPVQPGCHFDIGICSHSRSYYYYVDALLYEKKFLAAPCNSYSDFKNARCCKGITEMGPRVNKTARGKYFLFTNENSPFGMGRAGIVEPCWSSSYLHV